MEPSNREEVRELWKEVELVCMAYHTLAQEDNLPMFVSCRDEFVQRILDIESTAYEKGASAVNEGYFSIGNKLSTPDWQKLDQMKAYYYANKKKADEALEKVKKEVQ